MSNDSDLTSGVGTGKEGPKMDDGDLTSPDNVIPSESAARVVYERLIHAHVKRCWNYERIQGLLDGNPPYNPQAMQEAGLADMSNVNWKDGDAIYRSVALAYWSLFNDVENIAEFQVDFGDDETQKAEWGKIMSEEWDKALRSWPNFEKHMNFHQGELLKFGLNAIVWPDEDDWRFKPVNIKSFLVPDQTDNDIDCISLALIEHQYTSQFLWGVFEDARKNPGGVWDAEALGEILLQLAELSEEELKKHSINSCFDLQERIRNGDVYHSQLYNDDITLVSIFSKEFDGKITHHMIHPRIDTADFPYFLDRQYKDIREAFIFFTFAPGEETIHGNKGLGHSIFSSTEAVTQLDCSVLDQAKRSGSLIVNSGPNRGRDDRQIRWVHGGVVDIGEAELQQNTLGNNVEATVGVSQYFKQKILANNNVSGMDPAFPDRNVQSARAFQAQATKESKVQKNMIAHYYNTLDHLFREIVRKMMSASSGDGGWDYVEMWIGRCIARGVPQEIFDIGKAKKRPNGLPDFLDVIATRSAGSGSQIADQMEMREIMSLLPTFGERGKINAIKDFIAAFRGFRYIGRYFPPEDQNQQPVAEDTFASIENNQLKDGNQIVVSPDSNHVVHLTNHLRMMTEFMEAYRGDPQGQFDKSTNMLQKVDEVFSVAGPHVVKHLFFLQGDDTRSAEFQQLNAEWNVLANFGNEITNNAQRQREAEAQQAQQQQQAQAEQDAQNTPQHIKARGDIEVKREKAAAEAQLNREKAAANFSLEREGVGRRAELDKMKAISEVSIKARKELKDDTNK